MRKINKVDISQHIKIRLITLGIFLVGRWESEHKREYFYRQAKLKGYRSRAAYKLMQANHKYHFIKKDAIILDLGCAPGSWLQVVSELVGSTGYVLGVDIRPIEPLKNSNVQFMKADILENDIPRKVIEALGRKVDVVISDASPHISGVWEIDHTKQIDLAGSTLSIARTTLQENGNYFVKVFDGPLLKKFITQVRQHFCEVKVMKPEASRSRSAELYILAKKLRKIQH
jgi:23S rRNA (uridine2552-2'-O)-methyltransferase